MLCGEKGFKILKPLHSSIRGMMTLILRIKLTGIENMADVKRFITAKLKVRINEIEQPIINKKDLNQCKWRETKSESWSEGELDMLQATVRFT